MSEKGDSEKTRVPASLIKNAGEGKEAEEASRRKGAPSIAIWLLLILMVLGVTALFSVSSRRSLPLYDASHLTQTAEGVGLFVFYPKDFTKLKSEAGVALAGYPYGAMLYLERVDKAFEAHLKAGYTDDEAMDAILEAARAYIADQAVVDSYQINIGDGGGAARFGFEGQNKEALICDLRLSRRDGGLLLGAVIAGQGDEENANKLLEEVSAALEMK